MMEVIDLKTRLARGEVLFGTFMKLNCPQLAEIFGYAGLDFIILDAEHGNYSYTELQDHVRAANCAGMSAVVRVPNAQEQHILHAGDMGAQGIQVPNLRTAEEADLAVRQMRYYPAGCRGFSLTTRGARYTLQDPQEYLESTNRSLLSVIMVENQDLADKIPALCANPLIDVIFLGTADLSQDLGHPGQAGHPEVQRVVAEVTRQARAGGKAVGIIAGSGDEVRRYLDMGIQYIAFGAEVTMIASKFRDVVDQLRAACRRAGARAVR